MTNDRELDVVVYGATGFVGRLTAQYFAEAAPEGVRIGLGGRSQDKLERLRSELGVDWPLVVADSQDEGAVRELAERTRVVATTVGPYAKYGVPLVAACAATGTHYADLTGEPLFVRDIIDRYDGEARASGARIVNFCGFDSIPSDIGTLLLHEAAGELTDTTLVVRRIKGGPSGGTIDSARTTVDAVRADRSKMRILGDPYALSPDRGAEPDLGEEGDLRGARYDEELRTWLGPFVMAQTNTRVVRRSNALQDWAYGRRFRYREVTAFGEGIMGRARALGMAGALGAFYAGMAIAPARLVLDRVLPDPGEGPSEEAVRNGFFHFEIHARTPGGERWTCTIKAQGDPGYGATRVMLAESALCLALDLDRLPDRAGILTPATAMGTRLAERLRDAGHTYEVIQG